MASLETRNHPTGTTYRVIWYEDGKKQPAVTFTDAADAVRFRKLVEGSGNRWPSGWQRPQRAEPPGRPDVLTFGQWAETAITRRTRANERTKADYRRDLERHFADLLDVPLAELDTGHVAEWVESRRKQNLSDKTIRNHHGFASSLYVDALAVHPPLALHNPFAAGLGDMAAVHVEEMIFFTPPEFGLIIGHVRDERHYPQLIELLYGTGLRYGEATALRVRDVELLAKRKTVTVTKAWKRTGPATWIIGEPKTARSRRTVPLSPGLIELLIPLVSGRRGDELLFPGADGGRLPHSEVYKRAWAPAIARANVCATHYAPQRDGHGKPPRIPKPCDCPGVLGKRPRIHDIRHGHVAALITEGVRLEIISRRLGHASIKITMDRYGHLDPSLDDVVNAAVDRSLARR